MSPAFKILSCHPGDALFSEVLPGIYGEENIAAPRDEADRDYLVKCLVVMQDRAVLGRLAVYQNPAMMHLRKPVAQFGGFEAFNNEAAIKYLLGAGLDIARSLGAGCAIGPLNGSTWNQYRFISDRGDTPLFFTEQSQPDYYPALWQGAGFGPFQEYLSNIAPIPAGSYDAASFFAAQDFQVRNIDAASLRKELEALYPLCSAAFVKNPLSTPISKEKFIAKLIPLAPVIAGSFTKIVFDSVGTPVAFILCLPDIFDKSGKTLIVKTAAKHPGCLVPGLMSELYKVIMSQAHAAGYRHIIHAFIHLDNRSLKRSHQFDGKLIRRYALYIHPC